MLINAHDLQNAKHIHARADLHLVTLTNLDKRQSSQRAESDMKMEKKEI